jgi:hypothetical protein
MNIRQTLKPLVPAPVLAWRRRRTENQLLADSVKPLHSRTCPICDYRGFFTHFGRPPRLDACCPSCGSLERQRLFWLWLQRDGQRLEEPILHFAPEQILQRKLRELYKEYLTSDLSGKADLQLNIESIELLSGSVATVLCNHVLEHVSDRKALGEIHRILSDRGRLIVSVPIVEGWERTYEDESIQDPALRALHFGQSDHVRYYGRDFRNRLRDAGFSAIEEVTAEGSQVIEFALLRGEKFFICGKD